MKHVSAPSFPQAPLLACARRGALLLVLGISLPAAHGQSFGAFSSYPTGGTGQYAIAMGDVTGDGLTDIVTVSFDNTTASVLAGLVGGGFASAVNYATAPNNAPTASGGAPQGVALGDVNGDGRRDIVVANTFASNVGVLLSLAGGGFAPYSTYSTGANSAPRGVALGDVNGDGRLDIVTANGNTGTVGVLLGVAAGGFGAASAYAAGLNSGSTVTIPYGVALGDVNGDGRLDIVSANDAGNNVGVLLGLAAGGFAPFVNYSTGTNSSPTRVAVGDVNGDGRLDIVTANVRADSQSLYMIAAVVKPVLGVV
ncbi:VCBS repeat-containing protein, partial [Hymenobacter glaciei]|uniref:FG-GAP repeat domain-containing protein n=1 Tax=Hymenobacter glaciei TaxID=877209 RepID=UPI0031ECF343